jgi:hypothetical protein
VAYVSKELVQKTRTALAPVLMKYGVKGTVSGTNGSTLTLTISVGLLDFIGQYCETNNDDRITQRPKNLCINRYWFHLNFSGEILDFLKEVNAIMNDGNHDNSDIHTDYFDVGWYTDIKIGKWNKPYLLISK